MISISTFAQRLRKDEQGAYIIEYALLFPFVLLSFAVIFEWGHYYFMKTTVVGFVNAAGRESGLATSGPVEQAQIDNWLRAQIYNIHGAADVNITRTSFNDFIDAAQEQEEFTDTNGDGTCNCGEPYKDVNHSNAHDRAYANTGSGGAQDAVVYNVVVTWPSIMRGFLGSEMITKMTGGWETTNRVEASSVLANQPWAAQNRRTVQTRSCSGAPAASFTCSGPIP